MKKIIYLSFLALLTFSTCKKKSEETKKITVVGTWQANSYYDIISNCGNGSNPGSSSSSKDASQLSDILIIKEDGTGTLNSNGEIIATFHWTFSAPDIYHNYITLLNYKIIKSKSDDVILNGLINYQYVINTFGFEGINFYSLEYPSASNPCFYDEKIYGFQRLSY